MKKQEDHNFDEQIRQKMSNLQPEANAPDWSNFEELLDNAEELDAGPATVDPREVDEVIFAKMHQFGVPYEPSHWDKMEAKLTEWFTWPQYVLRYKSMELALFLLLFVTCWQYLPKMGKANSVYSSTTTTEPVYASADNTEKGKPAAIDTENASLTIKNEVEKNSHSEFGTSEKGTKETVNNNYTDGTATPVASAPKPTTSTSLYSGKALSEVLALLPGKEEKGQSVISSQASATPQFPADLMPLFSPEDEEKISLMEEADLIPKRSFAVQGEADHLKDEKIKKIRKGPSFLVGMFSSVDYNHIVVPASLEKRLSESFERAALGYGGGLSISADFGRLEVETGAIYAARYYPVGIVYVEGGLLSGLRGDELRTTELNMLNIPLHLRYDYIQHKKWRAYVLGGGSVQVAFQTNYYTAEVPQFDFMPAIPPPVTDGGEETEIDRIRRNGQGWFEDGNFEDNAYLTLNFGFGAERYFSERWSLFVQPVYQHSIHYFKNIDGLGPNNDRINSLSVFFGTRVRLK